MDSPISLEQFRALLPSLCSRETAVFGGVNWPPAHPLWGHCVPASLLVQNLFGGSLLISPDPDFPGSYFHCFNRLPDGTEVDITRDAVLPVTHPREIISRSQLLENVNIQHRYTVMALKFVEALVSDATDS